jgi:hypothetical protein
MRGSYDQNVFVNCPFDPGYVPLFRAMVFAVHDCGFIARCALESMDAGEVRIRKIMQIIRESRYGIHDISKVELDQGTHLPRFNMPLELGIFMAAREFGQREQKLKACLILDRERYRYQAFCSDIAGQDIRAHSNQEEATIRAVRDFLANQRASELLPAGSRIAERFDVFCSELPAMVARFHLSVPELTFTELRNLVLAFLRSNTW